MEVESGYKGGNLSITGDEVMEVIEQLLCYGARDILASESWDIQHPREKTGRGIREADSGFSA